MGAAGGGREAARRGAERCSCTTSTTRGKIMQDGVCPADLVFGNANYRPEMEDFPVRFGTYVHICGIDIVRDAGRRLPACWRTMRARPPGVSYVVENRHMMLRAFPDLMAGHAAAPGRRLRPPAARRR